MGSEELPLPDGTPHTLDTITAKLATNRYFFISLLPSFAFLITKENLIPFHPSIGKDNTFFEFFKKTQDFYIKCQLKIENQTLSSSLKFQEYQSSIKLSLR